MIIGLGTDIVEIKRIAKLIDSYGKQFLAKVFTEAEIQWCGMKANPSIHFAGRWAAKEAFYKALPLSLQPHSTWKSIEIIPDSSGRRPCINVCSKELSDLLKLEKVSYIHISISHEQSMCIASVILDCKLDS